MLHQVGATVVVVSTSLSLCRTVTECEVKARPATRRVCTFKYLQADHNVPATNVQVGLNITHSLTTNNKCLGIKHFIYLLFS